MGTSRTTPRTTCAHCSTRVLRHDRRHTMPDRRTDRRRLEDGMDVLLREVEGLFMEAGAGRLCGIHPDFSLHRVRLRDVPIAELRRLDEALVAFVRAARIADDGKLLREVNRA